MATSKAESETEFEVRERDVRTVSNWVLEQTSYTIPGNVHKAASRLLNAITEE